MTALDVDTVYSSKSLHYSALHYSGFYGKYITNRKICLQQCQPFWWRFSHTKIRDLFPTLELLIKIQRFSLE